MAYTTIDNPTDYFNTVLYTGDGTSSKAVTGVGFQPDWVWLKARSATYSHQLFDVARGATQLLTSEATDAEQTLSGVTSFDSDGFTVGSDAGSNNNTTTFVSWNWLAGGSASSNTDGSITSSVSANTTAGFSIVTFTTSSGSSDTIGHGLGVAPSVVICKATAASDDWFVFHESLGATKRTRLNLTNATDTNTIWNDTAPTSSVFSLRLTNFGTSRSGVAYCFAEKKGYSKFGSYTGNGSTNGTFIYTGFKPAFVIFKRTDGGSDNWLMYDNTRNPFNSIDKRLYPDASDGEDTGSHMDFVSNGIKFISSTGGLNGSGNTYIYMAFAESPFVTSKGIPTTAR